MKRAVSGVCSDGFKTIVFPVAEKSLLVKLSWLNLIISASEAVQTPSSSSYVYFLAVSFGLPARI